MLYNTNTAIKLRAGRFRLFTRIIIAIILSGALIISSACSLLVKPLDNRIGFSNNLKQLENSIRTEDWPQAKISLEDSKKSWEKLKPLLQVEIDHDYVTDIEDNFIKLDAYIDTKDKSNSLAAILLIEDIWKNIGSF